MYLVSSFVWYDQKCKKSGFLKWILYLQYCSVKNWMYKHTNICMYIHIYKQRYKNNYFFPCLCLKSWFKKFQNQNISCTKQFLFIQEMVVQIMIKIGHLFSFQVIDLTYIYQKYIYDKQIRPFKYQCAVSTYMNWNVSEN